MIEFHVADFQVNLYLNEMSEKLHENMSQLKRS